MDVLKEKEEARVRKDNKSIDTAAVNREKDKKAEARRKELKKQGLSDSAIAMRLKVEGNIAESQQARDSSGFGEYAEKEGEIRNGGINSSHKIFNSQTGLNKE